jgi:hypothetical protein
LIFFFIAPQIESVGQVFPVQSTVQLTPPYSLYLSDYVAPGSERMRMTAFLVDATRPELNVRFRVRIEGNGIKIETKPEFLPPPVTLLGGVPLQMVSSDMAAYFDPRNLNFSGITQREYEQRGSLPEGLYQFCLEVLEYNRGAKISNTGCATAWLVLNDPPFVNLPRDNDKVRAQDPQQVVFQWTPRHRGSPNSAFNTEYDFKLVEVWPATRNPNDAILTSPVIFQTTTQETTLIYGPTETPLEMGRRYAFQLRARAYAGADEVSLFKNNGLSQVYTFVYGDACLPPQNITTSDIGSTRFSVNFDAAPNQTSYSLRYRPIPNPQVPSSNWYTNTSLTTNLTINSLQPNTRYEYQLTSSCGSQTSDYSLLTNVTTNDNPGIQYSCGVPLTPFNLDPSHLINNLKVGDEIKAGDFDVLLTKVFGSNGTFSGEGVIEVSYFNRAKVKAEFTNIRVSNEMRLVDGYLNVTGAGVEILPASLLNLMDDLTETLAKADQALDDFEKNLPEQVDVNAAVTETLITVGGTASISKGSDGSVVVTSSTGQRTEIPAGTTASVVDSSGKGYIVDKKGNVHTTTAAIATQASNREYNLKIKFAASPEQKFGFDEKKHEPIASTYTQAGGQYLSWKSVATGSNDPVLATLEGTSFDKSKIKYELGGTPVPNAQSPSSNSQALTVRGCTDGTEEELIALYNPTPNSQFPSSNAQSPSSKTQVLGKLSVVTYDEIVKDLVIVPVNGNKYPYGEDALRTQLNKIYGQAVVKWNITFAQNIDVAGIDPFDDGGSGLLSNYSPDMRKVVSAYKANLQPHTYYLFLVTNPKSGTLAGFMPRSKQCGFIFLSSNPQSPIPELQLVRTIAHELGHGAFTLKHTFADEEKTIQEGTTDNLMDYAVAGTALYKYQWDRMRYPEIVMGLFEGDDAGALVALPCLGIFDDCDDVIKKLDAIKVSYKNKVIAKGKIPSKLRDRILEANYLKIEETEYRKIHVIYCSECVKDANDVEYSIDPTKFSEYYHVVHEDKYDYSKQIVVHGFEFKDINTKQKILRVLIEENSPVESIFFNKLKDYLFSNKVTVDNEDIIEKFKKSSEQAVKDAINAVGDEESPACNVCARAAFYYLTKDAVLFPKKGSCIDDFATCKASGDNFYKGKVSGEGSATDIINDLESNELKEYFVEEAKVPSESYEQFWKRLQDMADYGSAIIGTYKTDHIFMIIGGGLIKVIDNSEHSAGGYLKDEYKKNPNLEEGDKYGFSFAGRKIVYVPRIVECGINVKSSNAPLYANMDYKGSTEKVKWYKYLKK